MLPLPPARPASGIFALPSPLTPAAPKNAPAALPEFDAQLRYKTPRALVPARVVASSHR